MSKCKFANPKYQDKMDLYADTRTDDNPAAVYTLSVGSMPGNILTMGGDEKYRGQQLEAHITHVVETPWRTGITADQRMTVVGGIYDGRLLNIDNVQPIRPVGAMPVLVLHCMELEP